MKKLISVLLLFLIVFSSVGVFAYEETPKQETATEVVWQKPTCGIKGENITYIKDNNYISLNEEASSLSFEEYLYSCALEQMKTIDISAYKILTENFNNIFHKFIFDHPDVFILNDGYTVTSGTRYVISVTPNYIVDKSERESFNTLLNNKLEEYENLVKNETDELKKYLLIHSKMIRECHYDYTFEDASFTGYGFFANQSAVCQGYASALKIICDKVGLEAKYCLNKQTNINHMWNYIKINGNWYHTDVTWDDYSAPLTNSTYLDTNDQGAVHTNFLCSDATYILNGHGTKSYYNSLENGLPTCNDTTYESDDWIFNIKGSNGGSYLTDFTYEKDNLLMNVIGIKDSNRNAVKFVANNLSGKDIYSSIPCVLSTGLEYRFYSKGSYPKINARLVMGKEEKITHIQSVPLSESDSGGFYLIPTFTTGSDKINNADNFKLYMWSSMIPLTGNNSVNK